MLLRAPITAGGKLTVTCRKSGEKENQPVPPHKNRAVPLLLLFRSNIILIGGTSNVKLGISNPLSGMSITNCTSFYFAIPKTN